MSTNQEELRAKLQQRVAAAVVEGLVAYAQSGVDLPTFLAARHGAEVGAALLEHVRGAHSAAAAVAAARAAGISPATWLGDALTHGGALPADQIEGVARLLPTEQVADASGSRVGRAILDAVMIGVSYTFGPERSAALGEGLALLDVLGAVPPEASALVDAFFTSSLGDKSELRATAAAASGVQSAMEQLGLPPDPAQAVFIADVGMTAAKAGYKLIAGELSGVDEVAEIVEDRIAANIGAAAGRIFAAAAPNAGASIGAMIEAVIPMGGAAIQAGRAIGGMVGAALRPMVEQGVKAVTSHVLSAARELVKGVGATVVSAVKSLFGWILS